MDTIPNEGWKAPYDDSEALYATVAAAQMDARFSQQLLAAEEFCA